MVSCSFSILAREPWANVVACCWCQREDSQSGAMGQETVSKSVYFVLEKKNGGKKYLANVSRVVSVIYGVESWGRKSSKPSEG